jgi:hypothetical protein
MRELSEDARWQVSPNVNYLRLSAEFQDLAGELATTAKDKNLDGATLAYVKLTMNCVKCHKLVRAERLITLGPREEDRGDADPFNAVSIRGRSSSSGRPRHSLPPVDLGRDHGRCSAVR